MRQFASGRECEILSKLRSNTFTRSHRAPLLLLLCCLSPISARADAGIPMIAIAYPAILFLIIPVIAVEAAYLRLRLRTGWKNTLGAVAKANAITMLLGFPLAWLILFLLELAIWGVADWSGLLKHFERSPGSQLATLLATVISSPWLGPGTGETWPILVAFSVLLIPSFFLSAYVESVLLDRLGWLLCERPSTPSVWRANALSYIFLGLAGCALVWYQLRRF